MKLFRQTQKWAVVVKFWKDIASNNEMIDALKMFE